MNMKKGLQTLAFLLMVVCTVTSTWAADIYVDDTAPGANNGSNWYNAYRYLQDGLAGAQSGDTVKVAQGIYKPNQASTPSSIGRMAAFELKTGVTVRGGYAGYNPLPPAQANDQNPSLYQTVLSGDLNGDDFPIDPNDHSQIRLLLNASTRQDNSYSVVTASNTQPSAVLDGVTITGGNANKANAAYPYLEKNGGGVASSQGKATLMNCLITANAALENGGGFYNLNGNFTLLNSTIQANFCGDSGAGMFINIGSPKIDDCLFQNNVVDNQGIGGGLLHHDGDPKITKCTFKNNYGGRLGGGVYAYDGDPNFVDCVFEGNSTRFSGGAIELSTPGSPRLERCVFLANESQSYGGAAYNDGVDVTYLHCSFIMNETSNEGGAVYNYRGKPQFINCLVNGNHSDGYGGGMSFYVTEAVLTNCTFSSNSARQTGHGLAFEGDASIATITNCILWDKGGEIFANNGSTLTITYSTIYDYWQGQGNKFSNPLFADIKGPDNIPGTEDDDLRLTKTSPPIDAGSNFALPLYLVNDLDGRPRRIDDPNTSNSGAGTPPLVDMGAYEFGYQGNRRPIANAGPDQTVLATPGNPATVFLDGSGSYDPDNDPLSYEWTWYIGNQKNYAYGVNPSIQLYQGHHAITLIVYDSELYSTPDVVLIHVNLSSGLPPVADAGPDQTVNAGAGGYATVQLDGSGSYDPDGRPITAYNWNWSGGNATGKQPNVQLPVGQHYISLIVSTSVANSSPDYVIITVNQAVNHPPVANAGPDQTVMADYSNYAQVQMNGSGSSDPDGDPIQQYKWTWYSDSQSHQAFGVAPSISLPVGTHWIQLVVSDGQLSSNPDFVTITVNPPAALPPVANAGPDQQIIADQDNIGRTYLNGSGSSDPGGRPLTYKWTWTINSQNYQATGVNPPVWLTIGTHTIKLVVNNGQQNSAPDYVVVTVTPQAQEFKLWLYPYYVTPYDDSPYVLALMDITNVPANDIDMSRSMTLSPGNIVAIGQHVTPRNEGNLTATIFAFFDESLVLFYNPQNGLKELTVRGWLKNGQQFTGKASVVINH